MMEFPILCKAMITKQLLFMSCATVEGWFCTVLSSGSRPLSASERRSEQSCHEGDVQELR